MTRTAVFRPQAGEEVVEVRGWYDARRPGLGDEFGAEFDAAVTRILERPLAYPSVHGEIRRAVLNRFPFAIYYRVTADAIIVLAVHGRQHPRRWERRS